MMRHMIRFFIAILTLVCIVCFSGWQLSSLATDAGVMFRMLDSHAQAGLEEHHADIAVMVTKYLSDKTDVFQVEVAEGEEKIPVFNAKEQTHMEDVKELVALGRNLRWVMLGSLIVFGLLYFVNKHGMHRIAHRDVEVGAAAGVLVFYGVFLALALWCVLDFTNAFHTFHTIFFDNDFWLLDPQRDRLIQLMPESFFADYAWQLIKQNLTFYVGILLAALYFVFGRTKETA